MDRIKALFTLIFILLVSLLVSCTPQAATDLPPTQPESTQTSIPPTATFTPLPTETSLPTNTPSPIPPSCAVPLNPADNATVPARGPFDFTWTAFAGASSYVISIGPKDWYPTNFPVNGTTLTRYMETFSSSSAYEWRITALDTAGQEICSVGPYTFVTSKDLYATPSFAGGVITQPTISQPDSQEANPPEKQSVREIEISLISVEGGACSVTAAFSVTSKYPIDFSVLRYGVDPNEANSTDFCNWGSGVNLWETGTGTYSGGVDLSNFLYVHNGDVLYLMAKFRANGGLVQCSQLITQTITGCPDR